MPFAGISSILNLIPFLALISSTLTGNNADVLVLKIALTGPEANIFSRFL
jgi:hypothetical protein